MKKILIRGMQAKITQTDASTCPQKLTGTRSSCKLHVSQERKDAAGPLTCRISRVLERGHRHESRNRDDGDADARVSRVLSPNVLMHISQPHRGDSLGASSHTNFPLQT